MKVTITIEDRTPCEFPNDKYLEEYAASRRKARENAPKITWDEAMKQAEYLMQIKRTTKRERAPIIPTLPANQA